MSYPDYTAQAIRRSEQDAVLFAAVGLGWLSRISAQRAERLRAGRKPISNTKSKTS